MIGLARVAVLFVALTTAASCGLDASGTPSAHQPEEVPFNLLEEDAPPLVPTSAPANGLVITLCLVTAENRLEIVAETAEPPLEPLRIVRRLALTPDDDDILRSAISEPGVVRSAEVRGGVATIDLSGEITALNAGELQLAIAQLVCTLTGLPGVGQVAFTLDGVPTEVPTTTGALTSEPISREDIAELIA